MAMRAFVMGLGLGVGLMYWLDPDRGRRRRAVVRDELMHWREADAAERVLALRDRARGVMAEARERLHPAEEPVDDAALAERVRAKLTQMVSHPQALRVSVNEGCVTVAGPILAHEAEALISRVLAIHGVKELNSELDLHERAEGVPGLDSPSRGASPGVF